MRRTSSLLALAIVCALVAGFASVAARSGSVPSTGGTNDAGLAARESAHDAVRAAALAAPGTPSSGDAVRAPEGAAGGDALPGNQYCVGSPYGCGFFGVGPVSFGGYSACYIYSPGATYRVGCGAWGTGPIAIGGNSYCNVSGLPVNDGSSQGCGSQGTGPIALFGDSWCYTDGDYSFGCGYMGTGPIALFGDARCMAHSEWGSNGCGFLGTGPIAVLGDADCSQTSTSPFPSPFTEVVPGGCGYLGTGPIAVGGNASCDADDPGCGYAGTGPIAVVGNASCHGDSVGCGYLGTGPVTVVGDVSCSGTCGGRAPQYVGVPTLWAAGYPPVPLNPAVRYFDPSPLPRTGTPGVTVWGTASCGNEFDRTRVLDFDHLGTFQCVSAREAILGF